jgi:hypothetical protein
MHKVGEFVSVAFLVMPSWQLHLILMLNGGAFPARGARGLLLCINPFILVLLKVVLTACSAGAACPSKARGLFPFSNSPILARRASSSLMALFFLSSLWMTLRVLRGTAPPALFFARLAGGAIVTAKLSSLSSLSSPSQEEASHSLATVSCLLSLSLLLING